MEKKTIFIDKYVAAAQNSKEKKYWLNKLSGELVKSNFYYDFKPKNVDIGTFGKEEFRFTGELFSKFLQLSNNSDLRLHMVLTAGLVILIEKYTGERDIIIGTPVYKEDIEEKFVNTILVLRNIIDTGQTFKELLVQVRQTILEAAAHVNYPVELLSEQLGMPVSNQKNFPLFDIVILLENIHDKKYVEHINYNIAFSFSRKEDTLEGVVEYNAHRYHKKTIEKIVKHFISIFKQVLFDVNLKASRVDIISEVEKRKLLNEFNDTRAAFPKNKTIHQLFEEQAERTPEKIAVCSPVDLSDKFTAISCFKKNPYIFESHLGSLKILKTNSHNSVVINKNMLKLIDCFTGENNLESVFSILKDFKNAKFVIFTSQKKDLLGIAHEFNRRAHVFLNMNYNDFISLVQLLYKNNLIKFHGINSHTAIPGKAAPAYDPRESNESFDDRTTLKDLLKYNEVGLAKVDVLLLGDTQGMPTTGLLYMASYLRRNRVKALCRFYDDADNFQSMAADIEKMLARLQPRVVGISMKWFLYIARVLDMCKIIKEYSRRHGLDIKVVVGGNTASYYWEEIVNYDFIDYIVRGDGEEPLLKIFHGEKAIPNAIYRQSGKIIENPITYIQGEKNSTEIYLSHLDEILVDKFTSLFGTFFVYTHKGCAMNCLYCGGCNKAQQKAFNRKTVLRRGIEEIRKDIIAVKKYASTLHFDFDIPDKNLADYCRKIWQGIDLSGHFCLFSTLTPPSTQLVELVSRTFKYVYWDFDICTPSQRHREQLESLGLVKPQPTDAEIMEFMTTCENFKNIEVRPNLITGLPYFTSADIEPGEKLLSEIMNTFSCFGELHWARLHAQPGAPILENAEQLRMNSFATSFEDFLEYSKENFNRDSGYVSAENFNYPYIYFKDDHLNSQITNFYLEINKEMNQYKNEKTNDLIILEKLTYRHLNERAARLAKTLTARGVQPGDIAGLMLERSLYIPVGILAVLKCGAAYLPIDPEFPGERIKYMLKDTNAAALVTTRDLNEESNKITSWEGEKILLEPAATISSSSTLTSTSTCQVNPANLAYVIYTSGTTGKPKGVAIKHQNLVNYVYWFSNKTGLTDKDKTILTTSFAFDLGYTSLYNSLLNGGELHILPRETYLLAEPLLGYIKKKEITFIKVTPSLFSMIVNSPGFSKVTCKSLRLAAVGGEPINVKDIEKAHSLCGHLVIMNHYGPTEATIGCAATIIDFHDFEEYKVHPVIGKPIHNTRVYILDKDLNLLPRGVPGELCVSGTCLAPGYLNRPELTADKFFTVFYRSYRSHMSYIYSTGDLARWMPNGTIEFLGRIDKQVKIRGYRIEPGEIENRLLKHGKIENALVLVKEAPPAGESDLNETGDSNKYLCAYIVPKEKGKHKGSESFKEKPVPDGFEEEYPNKIVQFVGDFQEIVKKNQDKIAVKSNSRELTYSLLDKYAARVAREILQKYDDTYSLSNKERQRYKRQMLLHGWGTESQEKLKSTTVFVAGAGGGGSPTIIQLALLGFGTIKICDFDDIELSNLNRQFLHNEKRIGMNKVLSAQMTVKQTNPHVNVITYKEKLTRENGFELVGDSAVIFDMFDGPADKFILSECAVVKQIPHIIIAMADLNSYSSVCHTPHTPCYHCIFDRQKLETITAGMRNYVEDYSKNPLAVASPSLFTSTGTAVTEALKILLGFDWPAYNKFFYFNQRGAAGNLKYTPSYQSMTQLFTEHFRRICQDQGFNWDEGWRGNFMEVLDIEPDPDCPLCGTRGREMRKALEQRMKKAKQAPIPVEVDQEAAIKEKNRDKKKTVALLLNHDIALAAGIIAAWKSGKTCVPFAPVASMDNLSEMLSDSEARIILTDNDHLSLAEKLKDKVNKNIKVIDMGPVDEPGVPGESSPAKTRDMEIETDPGQKAYILNSHNTNASPGFNESIRKLHRILVEGKGPYVFNNDNKKQSRESAGDLLSTQLRDYLLEVLPGYMIPSYFVQLEKIPLTPNGKIDRKALPEPDPGTTSGYIAPRNEIEETLAGIWSEVLGIEKDTISIDASFFSLGGHSLNATIMAAKIHEKLNIKVPLGDLFKTPTIGGLAGNMQVAEIDRHTSIAPIEEKEYYQLSSAQKRIYVFQQMNLESTSYNMPLLLELVFEGNHKELSGAFNQLIKRHESLRTSFKVVNVETVQRVHRDVEFEIEYYEPDSLEAMGSSRDEIPQANVEVELEEEGTRKQIMEKIINNFFKAFDLSRAPLLRVGLLHIPSPGEPYHIAPDNHKQVNPGTRYFLMIDMHHIITDGFSLEILKDEFDKLYTGRELPPLRLQYKDYSEWQNNRMKSSMMIHQQEYWLRKFERNISPLNFPVDYERPEIQGFDGDRLGFRLGKEETKALKKMSLEKDITLFMILLAAYNIFLAKICRQEDIIIGVPTAGRGHSDLEQVIGMFVNVLAMRNQPEGSKTFEEFLWEVKENALEAYENQDYQFDELMRKIGGSRNLEKTILVETHFIMQNIDPGADSRRAKPINNKNAADGETKKPHREGILKNFKMKKTRLEIALFAVEEEEKIVFRFFYMTSLFKKYTIEKFCRYFANTLETIAKTPAIKISEIELLTGEEKNQMSIQSRQNKEIFSRFKEEDFNEVF